MPVAMALTKGEFALVDDEDYERLSAYSWHLAEDNHTNYAKRGEWDGAKNHSIRMHREILGFGPGDPQRVDHRDGNGLHNCKSNLRVVTQTQNIANKIATPGRTSKFKGVYLFTPGVWRTRIIDFRIGKCRELGCFNSEDAAGAAYDAAVRELHGEFGTYNFPLPGERSALTGEIMPINGVVRVRVFVDARIAPRRLVLPEIPPIVNDGKRLATWKSLRSRGHTLKQIAEASGVSKQRVQQVLDPLNRPRPSAAMTQPASHHRTIPITRTTATSATPAAIHDSVATHAANAASSSIVHAINGSIA